MERRRYFPVFSAWPQLLCLTVTSVMAILAVLALIYLEKPEPQTEAPLPALASAQAEQSSVSAPEETYLMKAHGGKLAVFRLHEAYPLLIFDVYVNTLPEYDQQLLQEGIPVQGKEQLEKRIEDYIS